MAFSQSFKIDTSSILFSESRIDGQCRRISKDEAIFGRSK
jgi:hypothetical protein